MIKSRARSMKAVAVLAIGFLIAGMSATAASAATATTSVVAPQCVPVDGVDYQPADPGTFRTEPNPNYVPAVEKVSHWVTVVDIEAVQREFHMEYLWKSWNWETLTFDTRWSATDPGIWWSPAPSSFNQESHEVEDRAFVAEVNHQEEIIDTPYQAAIGEPTIEVSNGDGQPEVQAVDAVFCEIGLYIYPKLRSGEAAGWENSGPQTFIASKNGTAPFDWYTSMGQLPPEVCGDGWGYQQDATKSGTPVDFASSVIEFPLYSIGWPPIYDAKHGELSDLIDVPDCIIPVDVQPTVTTTDPCGVDNATLAGVAQDGVVWSEVTTGGDGTLSITASPAAGRSFPEGFQTTFTTKDSGELCPIEITGVSVTVVDPPICGPNNDTIDIPEVEGLTFDDTGWVDGKRTITASADKGYVFEGESSWTFTDEATLCPVTTVAPTVVPICGPNNDTVTLPEVDGVIYTNEGWADGELTITAAAAEGFVLEGESSWTFTDVPVAACPDEPPAFSYTPTGELAYTGASTSTNGLTALAIFLMTAGTALVALRTRAAKQ